MADLILIGAAANAMLDALDGEINTGTGTATLKLYVGVEGTNPAIAPAGAELQVINLANPAFGAAAVTGSEPTQQSKMVLAADTPQAITASGTCGSFAIYNRNGTLVLKGDAGTTGTMLLLDTATIAGSGVDLTEASCNMVMSLNLNF